MVFEQVSQGVHPEVHSRRIWGPQGPDPAAFLYLAETWVVAVYFIYHNDGHISKSVSFSIKVFRHTLMVKDTLLLTWPSRWYIKYTAKTHVSTRYRKAGGSGPWKPHIFQEWTSGWTPCETCVMTNNFTLWIYCAPIRRQGSKRYEICRK